jgi:hypothetical protein
MTPVVCPNCRSSAPIVYRGVLAYCTSCGAPRTPLVARSTNHAGKPSMIGGALTRVAGWIVLSGGIAIGLALLGLLQALFPAGFAGFAVGGPIIVLAAVLGFLLLRGGKSLESTGEAEQRETRITAILSLGDHRGGNVTAADVATALAIPTARADEILTDLAKTRPEQVVLEIDEHGGVFYRVSSRGLSRVESFDEKLRVAQTARTEPAEPEQAAAPTHDDAATLRTRTRA